MYFHYLSDFLLPYWLKENISETRKLIDKADKELKFGIKESFESIPFNLVGPKVLEDKLLEVRQKYFEVFEKALSKNSKEGNPVQTRPGDFPEWDEYRFLLRKTFAFRPFSMIVKKGVSSGGKEVLVLCEQFPIPIFLFLTVYPLCWNALNEKNQFSINKHPIYPLFYRYMQEPLAMAMSLAVVDKAFEDEPHAKDYVVSRLHSFPMNYTSGVLLYNSGIYTRWRDWRDDSNRCYDKIDTIKEWIDLLSNSYETPGSEQIIALWAKLFNLTAGEVQGLKAAAKYAPIVSENKDLRTLLLGLLDYVGKSPKDFQNEKVRRSNNPIAKVVTQLVHKQITFEEAVERIPGISNEQVIRDFIGDVMTGWSFAQDLHDGCYRIYGPTIIAIAYNGTNDSSKSSKENKQAN